MSNISFKAGGNIKIIARNIYMNGTSPAVTRLGDICTGHG